MDNTAPINEKLTIYVPRKPAVVKYTYLIFHSRSKDVTSHGLPKDAMRRLSNFSSDPVVFEGNTYPSIEHAYQAQKYICSNRPEIAKHFYDGTIETAEAAKTAGGKGGMKKRGAALDFTCWSEKKSEDIMRSLVHNKVKSPEIWNILSILRKNHIRVVHFSRSDMFWGAHMNDTHTEIIKGKNKLGDMYNEIMYGNGK